MRRSAFFIFFITVLTSCSEEKHDPKPEIIDIVKRNTALDISSIPFTVVLDSVPAADEEFSYWRFSKLVFEPADFETLKSAIRTTENFNAFTLFDNWGSAKMWADSTSGPEPGAWIVCNTTFHFVQRETVQNIRTKGESAMIDVDTVNSTMVIKLSHYARETNLSE